MGWTTEPRATHPAKGPIAPDARWLGWTSMRGNRPEESTREQRGRRGDREALGLVDVDRVVPAAVRRFRAGHGAGRIDLTVVVEDGVRRAVPLAMLVRQNVPVNESVDFQLDDCRIGRVHERAVAW